MSNKYEVGYKRPPKHTRFKKGHKRKPARISTKRTQNASEYIDRALESEISAKIDGEQKKMSKQELMIRQLVASGLSGDIGSIDLLLRLMNHANARGEQQEMIYKVVPDSDLEADTRSDDRA